ncbi:MAG: methyltransferase [bacterium]
MIKSFVFKYLFKNKPLNRTFGYDRGTPIDRYYIENFLNTNNNLIKGNVIEVAENTYTKNFGRNKVLKSLILHANNTDVKADIIGNLETGENLPEAIADCFIMTQTLPFMLNPKEGIKNALKLLKADGVLLITVPGIVQISRYDMDRWGHYWSFTDLSLQKLLEEFVHKEKIEIKTYGNVKSACGLLYGYSQEEFTKSDLDHYDKDYQVTIAAVVRK